jgi:hypothetical protein
MTRHGVRIPQRCFVIAISLNDEVITREVGVGQVRAVIRVIGSLGGIAPWKLVVEGGDIYQGFAEQKDTPEERGYGKDYEGKICKVSAIAGWRYQGHPLPAGQSDPQITQMTQIKTMGLWRMD